MPSTAGAGGRERCVVRGIMGCKYGRMPEDRRPGAGPSVPLGHTEPESEAPRAGHAPSPAPHDQNSLVYGKPATSQPIMIMRRLGRGGRPPPA